MVTRPTLDDAMDDVEQILAAHLQNRAARANKKNFSAYKAHEVARRLVDQLAEALEREAYRHDHGHDY